MNDYEKHCIADAQQSNFRTLSLLTDPNGLSNQLMELKKYFLIGSHQRDEFNEAIFKLNQVLTQCTYTGRCLGGVLTPKASIHTDQRPHLIYKRDTSPLD
jgi:hypothetical protein